MRSELRITGVLASVFLWIITLSLIAENVGNPLAALAILLYAAGMFGSGLCVGTGAAPVKKVSFQVDDPLNGCVRGSTWFVQRDTLLYNGAPTLIVVTPREPNTHHTRLIPEDLFQLLERKEKPTDG